MNFWLYGRACETPFAELISSAKGVTFGGFTCGVAFGFAWQAWHFVTFRRFQTCFVTCRNPILCGRRNTFATFS